MKTASPLRYPGGKSAMTGLLADIRRINSLGCTSVAEPFAGGAGAALSLLYLEETKDIHINDADPSIHDLWWTLVNRPSSFLRKLDQVTIDIAEWRRQRVIYKSSSRVSRLRRGFSAFYLNRCNRSGIIMNAGPIGGLSQSGKWKLDARFNREGLRARCERVAEYSGRIHVSGQDGIKFINRLDPDSTFFFIDPPYHEKGPALYLNALDAQYHEDLAKQLRSMPDAAWVLTYDDCPRVRELYDGWASLRPFSLRYSASEKRRGQELMITPKWIQLPTHQGSAALVW